ncbi:MAG: 8-oxo-dGTP diphosphatase [Oscillospiraceae bacterium]|nr:8-oxo-dGTP diphosphatase [Oscillospiraceae bacterium]
MDNSTLCYIEKDDSYLMMHRVKKKNDLNHDKWIGIGGHFEFGESPYDCVIREAYEETGVTLVNPKYRGIVTFVTDDTYDEQMHLFTCTDYEGDLNLDCNEGDLEWVKKSEIKNLPIWEGDKIFFKLLDSDELFFSLKLRYEGDKLAEVVLNGVIM